MRPESKREKGNKPSLPRREKKKREGRPKTRERSMGIPNKPFSSTYWIRPR